MQDSSPIHGMLDILKKRPPTLIVAHNNPDPDSIASAQAMKYILLKTLKLRTRIVFGGYIGRAENQSMVHQLKIDLSNKKNIRLNKYKYFILIDTQEGFKNHVELPDPRKIIAIDHHPKRKRQKSTILSDIRPSYGASSTILTEYLTELELPVDPMIATGLYYGIKSDTMDFSRSYINKDFEAFKKLFPFIKNHLLARILRPSIPVTYLLAFANAVEHAQIYGKTVIVPLKKMEYPDITAEIADYFLRLDKITWSFCYGIYKDEMIFSLRTTSRIKNAGHVIRRVVGKLGSAGGHEMSGGAQIPLQNFQGDHETLVQTLISRYLKALGIKTVTGLSMVQKAPDFVAEIFK